MNNIEAAVQALTFLHLVWIILGVHSITRVFVADSILNTIRAKFFDQFPPTGHISKQKPPRGESIHSSNGWYTNKGTFLGELFSCSWCLGTWVSLVVSAAFLFFPVVTLAVLFPFAVRSAAGVIAYHNGG